MYFVIRPFFTEMGINLLTLLYYNNIISLPIIAVMTFYFEWDVLVEFENYHNIGFQVLT